MIPVELLSPAKNAEFGKTAIDFGADAVYIGAPKFGARASAGNSIEDIQALCEYAHRFHAKVYVAFNTILFDEELAESEKLIWQIYNAGADALIIQDMGITEMNLPPIDLHISTQGHNIDANHVGFLNDAEFSRVILGRELSPKQISEIHAETNIEIEAFVHGALCVSYSGRCYLSAHLGGRSGNRGDCAQPCRLAWNTFSADGSLLDKNKHVLSLRDMNRSAHLEEMLKAGVRSFKIEGRMKDLNYLKNLTAFYRQKLDDIIEKNPAYCKASPGKCTFDFLPDPEKTFNRRYNEYFPDENRKNLRSVSPKSVGKPLGKVVSVHKKNIVVETNERISNGDGLCYFSKSGELKGFAVQRAEGRQIFLSDFVQIENGTMLYRNLDVAFGKELENAGAARKIGINLRFEQNESGFVLKANCIGVDYKAESEFKAEKTEARNVENAFESLITQLSKTGGTPFYIENIDAEQGRGFFLPVSVVNALRRDVLLKLEALLGTKYLRKENQYIPNDIPYFAAKVDFSANVSNRLARKFWNRHSVEVTESAFEVKEPTGEIPLMTTKLCLRYEAGACPKYHKGNANSYPEFIERDGKKFRLKYHCDICRMEILKP